MSSRVSLSFKKQYGDRWALDGLGEKTVNAKADVTLSPKERWWRAFVRCDPRRHLQSIFVPATSVGVWLPAGVECAALGRQCISFLLSVETDKYTCDAHAL